MDPIFVLNHLWKICCHITSTYERGKKWKYRVHLTIRVFSIVFMFASAYRQGSLCSSKLLFSKEKQAIRSRLWAATALGGYAWYDPCETLPKSLSLASYRLQHVVLIIRYCCGFALQLGGKASRQGTCGIWSLAAMPSLFIPFSFFSFFLVYFFRLEVLLTIFFFIALGIFSLRFSRLASLTACLCC